MRDSSLNPHKKAGGVTAVHIYCHFTDEQVEAQRGEDTCPMSLSTVGVSESIQKVKSLLYACPPTPTPGLRDSVTW